MPSLRNMALLTVSCLLPSQYKWNPTINIYRLCTVKYSCEEVQCRSLNLLVPRTALTLSNLCTSSSLLAAWALKNQQKRSFWERIYWLNEAFCGCCPTLWEIQILWKWASVVWTVQQHMLRSLLRLCCPGFWSRPLCVCSYTHCCPEENWTPLLLVGNGAVSSDKQPCCMWWISTRGGWGMASDIQS